MDTAPPAPDPPFLLLSTPVVSDFDGYEVPEVGESASSLLRVSSDALLDPLVLVEAVRDPEGQVVDLVYRELNQATCDYLGLAREELLGHRVLELSPGLVEAGLFRQLVRCLDTGQPVAINDLTYDSGILHDTRRYDVRATRASATAITVTWRDVNDRFRAAQLLAEARELQHQADARYRRLVDNSVIPTGLVAPDGHFHLANQAMCSFFGYDADTLRTKTWQELTAQEYVEADQKMVDDVLAGNIQSYRMQKQYIHAAGYLIWGDLSVGCVRGPDGGIENLIVQIIDITAEKHAYDQLAAMEEQYRLLAENAVDVIAVVGRDGLVKWVSPSVETTFGAPPSHWIGRAALDVFASSEVVTIEESRQRVLHGGTDVVRTRSLDADGGQHWVEVHSKRFYDHDGQPDGFLASVRLIDKQVAAEQERDAARDEQLAAEAQFRRMMENSDIGTAIVAEDGRFEVVNRALYQFLGYTPEALTTKTWRELTPERYVENGQRAVEEFRSGLRDHYRAVKQYIHADGHTVWGDVSITALRNPTGAVEARFVQIVDVTEEVEARAVIDRQNALNAALAKALDSELSQAAEYMRSILPTDIDTGPVRVSSAYLPSRKVGGDSFDYRWLDEDHLLLYLLDVSGHGIAAALLSASIHNMIRSGSIPATTLRDPATTLAKLNATFPMHAQGDSYFTIWYGVYCRSTRTLRYASAGHPPALALKRDGDTVTAIALSTPATPIGAFEDVTFSTAAYTVPPACQLLIYSDGAYEFRRRTTAGNPMVTHRDFTTVCATEAAKPAWSLDRLVDRLQALSPDGQFDDDCALILATFA